MTISPIGTTCFGWLDVFSLAEKLSIVQFSLQVWAIIANIVNPYQPAPWWAGHLQWHFFNWSITSLNITASIRK